MTVHHMNLRKHYLMTCAALFFLGIVIAKPGASFHPYEKEERECKTIKGRKDCETRLREYRLKNQSIHYEYQ